MKAGDNMSLTQKNKCSLKEQVDSLFDLLPIQLENSKKTIEQNIHAEEFLHFRKIYFVGSGDSYLAALVGKRVFEKYANKYSIYFRVMKAMEFSRFTEFSDEEINQHSLMIIVSKSGIGSRVIEVLKRANTLNMCSLVISDSESSIACHLAKYCLLTNTPDFFNDRPALRSYFAALITLYLLAGKFSEMYGNSMTMEKLAKNIHDYMRSYKDKINMYDEKMMKLADLYQNADAITFIGDSDEEATCGFSVSKIIEVTGIHSKSDDSEEWGHINYFNKFTHTNPVFFIANNCYANISRMKETIRQSFAVGRPTYLIINEDAKMTDIPESCIIRLPFVEDEMLQPLGSYIPTAIFANHLADLLDEPLFRGNIYPQGFNTIRNSQVVVYGINGNKIKEI